MHDGVLRVAPYQAPGAPHGCERCPVNLCKSLALRRLLSSERERLCDEIFFVGDGGNDYCIARTLLLLGIEGQKREENEQGKGGCEGIPSLGKLLKPGCRTTVFARKGYALSRKLAKERRRRATKANASSLASATAIKAFENGQIAVCEWEDGDKLLRLMRERL